MQFATKERLLERGCDRTYAVVEIPGLGQVRLRSMSEAEQSTFRQSLVRYDDKGSPHPVDPESHRRRLLAATICDGDGQLICVGCEEQLGQLNAATAARLATAAQRLCGMADEESTREGAGKNSGAGPGDSPS